MVCTGVAPQVEATPSGPVAYRVIKHQVWGFTFEIKWDKEDEDFHEEWEQHDLGQHPALQVAHTAAATWREQLVGEYDIR